MENIQFWKDKDKTKIEPTLFSTQAEALAKQIASEGTKEINKRTQLRRFYDDLIRLNTEAKTREEEWDSILPLVNMLTAKAAYARGRKLISDNFVDFIRDSVNQVSRQKDLEVFANFFEAFMGFYRLYRKDKD